MMRLFSIPEAAGGCLLLALGLAASASDRPRDTDSEMPAPNQAYVPRGFASDGTPPGVNKGRNFRTAGLFGYRDPTYPVGLTAPGCAAPTVLPIRRDAAPVRSSGLVIDPHKRAATHKRAAASREAGARTTP